MDTMRVAMIPVWLNRANHLYAHEGAHNAALLWNDLVAWTRAEWANGRHPNKASIENYADTLKTYPIHSHTVQAVAHDLWEAIKTSRSNKANGRKARAPWRHKNYRPLSFTSNYGWRVTPEGKLNLSFGQGKGKGSRRRSILLPLPTVTDSRTGASVSPKYWGEIQLCWDVQNRAWNLHIPYQTQINTVPQAEPDAAGNYPANTVLIAADPGIINPYTLSVTDREANTVTALVVTGREMRSIKRGRNKQTGSIQSARSKTKPGSRKDKRLALREKKVKGKAARQLRNANHHVAKIVDTFVRDQAVDKTTGELRPVRLAVGDVRGIEKNTNRKRRASRSTRQQLSQWERGTQERYITELTGLAIEYIPEHHSSQTCPACPARRKVRGRVYKCLVCGTVLPRDLVGSGNLGSRAENGGVNVCASTPILPWVDSGTKVTVMYQRALRGWSPVQSALHSHHQLVLGRAGKPVVVASNRARARSTESVPVAEGSRVRQVTTGPLGVRGRESTVVLETQSFAVSQKPRP